jgi:hypothetical protein
VNRLRRLLNWTTLVASASLAVACGGNIVTPKDNRVFYHEDTDGIGEAFAQKYERPYQPLDQSGAPLNYRGVAVLDGAVRLSRPDDWAIRNASLDPEKRYIEYVSPRQFIFSIYERIESPREPWHVLMGRYQSETTQQGGLFLGPAVPTAVWNAQARAYDVKRLVPAPKSAFKNNSREYLVHGRNRILLIQVVHPNDSLEPLASELMRVVQTLQVL